MEAVVATDGDDKNGDWSASDGGRDGVEWT